MGEKSNQAKVLIMTSVLHCGPIDDPFRIHYSLWIRGILTCSVLFIPLFGWTILGLFNKTKLTGDSNKFKKLINISGFMIFCIAVYYGIVSDLNPKIFNSFILNITRYIALFLMGVLLYFCGICVPDGDIKINNNKRNNYKPPFKRA